MTCDDEWKKFIQVNIYGHTLQELEKQGVVLETMLNNVGCSKLWIVEGSMYSGDSSSPPNSTIFSDIAPVLSTTIADVKCPRFSTPAVTQVPLQTKFTLNLPVKLSEIHSNHEDEEIVTNNDFEDLVDELIQMVVEQEEELEETENPEEVKKNEKKSIFSTTLATIDVPRYSTPIRSDEAFTLNMPETLSDIESDGDDVIETDEEEPEEPKEPESEPRKPKRASRTVSILAPLTRKRSRRLSAPNLKIALGKIVAESKRKPPARTQSTIERHSSQRIAIKSSNSIHPKVPEDSEENSENSASKTTQEDNFQSVGSDIQDISLHSFIELKPVPFWSSPGAHFDFDGPSTSAQAAAAAAQNLAAPEFDFDYDNDGGRPMEDTIVMGYEQEEIVGGEDEWEDEEAEKTGFNARASKKVSFAEPLIQNQSMKVDMNKAHTVKCYFEGCTRSYTWRKKYGKIRLVDHAMTHVEELALKCEYCDYTCKGIRQIRYHHKRKHPSIKLESFGIKRIMNTNGKDTDFSKVWDKCFKKNLVLEKGSLTPFERLDKGVRRRNQKRDEEIDEMAEDGPFYFFRIR